MIDRKKKIKKQSLREAMVTPSATFFSSPGYSSVNDNEESKGTSVISSGLK
jgi:hypothetical protein